MRAQRQRRRVLQQLLLGWVAAGCVVLKPVLAQPQPQMAAGPQSAPPLPTFSPFDFGAKGDGIADDTAACNAAAARAQAAAGELVFPPGTFAISEYIVVRSGVQRVRGTGGVIKCINTRNDAGVLLAGAQGGKGDNVKGCVVQGLQVDCNHVESASTNGIYGQNISRCQIVDNKVFNLVKGHGIVVRTMAQGKEPAAGNVVQDNRIDADSGRKPLCVGIAIDAGLASQGPHITAPDQWKNRFIAPAAVLAAVDNTVQGNTVVGGYYGLSLSGASRNRVLLNRFGGNVRNISVQNSSTDNTIAQNICTDSISSAIHLAYGSSNNRITSNSIRTQRAEGEGLLQAYVGSMGNVFEGNKVFADAPARPRYHIYVAVHADYNKFINNQLSGTCSRAYIAIETAWDSASKDPAHRGYKQPEIVNHYARDGMAGVVIAGNVIDPTSSVPVFYLAQISDDRGQYLLKDCVVKDNTVRNRKASPQIAVVEQQVGGVSGVVLEGNTFPAGLGKADFQLPRGNAHFALIRGNAGLPVQLQ